MDGLTRQPRRYTTDNGLPLSPHPPFVSSFLPLSSVTFHRDSESPFRNIERESRCIHEGPKEAKTQQASREEPCVESRRERVECRSIRRLERFQSRVKK